MESWTSRQTFKHALTAVLHTALVLVSIYSRHKQTNKLAVGNLHYLQSIALRERLLRLVFR